MTEKQIKEFFKRLNKNLKTCMSNKEISLKILNAMKIARPEQKEFLKRCAQSGGYCDCEILMNAGYRIMKEIDQK